LWAVVLAGVPAAAALFRGPLFIDDAYITFRYAKNIAAGLGFVYDSEPILGTTAPLYALLLAAGEFTGIPVTSFALMAGAVCAALTPVLVWRLGVSSGRAWTGLVAGLMLAFFPHWWLNSKTGMETSLAGLFTVVVPLLFMQGRPALSGAAAGALVLVRPDCAILPALVFLFGFARDRKAAALFAACSAAVVLPWVVYGFYAFGSPLPHSLEVKRLIHHYPWHRGLMHYLKWFFALREPPGMALVSVFSLAGLAASLRDWKELRPLALFPLVFILALSLTEVGPFFWYKAPALPAWLLLAALGAGAVGRAGESRVRVRRGRALWRSVAVLPLAAVMVQAVMVYDWFSGDERTREYVKKESILRDAAEEIKKRAESRGGLGEVTVLAGEVGVIGFELMDARIIDSAGLNSARVYETRKRDWELMKDEASDAGWRGQWAGSPEWARQVIREFEPDFISTNTAYIHFRELAGETWFRERYRVVGSWRDERHGTFVLLERNLSP